MECKEFLCLKPSNISYWAIGWEKQTMYCQNLILQVKFKCLCYKLLYVEKHSYLVCCCRQRLHCKEMHCIKNTNMVSIRAVCCGFLCQLKYVYDTVQVIQRENREMAPLRYRCAIRYSYFQIMWLAKTMQQKKKKHTVCL